MLSCAIQVGLVSGVRLGFGLCWEVPLTVGNGSVPKVELHLPQLQSQTKILMRSLRWSEINTLDCLELFCTLEHSEIEDPETPTCKVREAPDREREPTEGGSSASSAAPWTMRWTLAAPLLFVPAKRRKRMKLKKAVMVRSSPLMFDVPLEVYLTILITYITDILYLFFILFRAPSLAQATQRFRCRKEVQPWRAAMWRQVTFVSQWQRGNGRRWQWMKQSGCAWTASRRSAWRTCTQWGKQVVSHSKSRMAQTPAKTKNGQLMSQVWPNVQTGFASSPVACGSFPRLSSSLFPTCCFKSLRCCWFGAMFALWAQGPTLWSDRWAFGCPSCCFASCSFL